MSTEDKSRENITKSFESCDRIEELCNIILIYGDSLDFDKAKRYIEEHFSNDVKFCEEECDVRLIVQRKVMRYIEDCPIPSQLFAFGSDNGFYTFRKRFKKYYEECSEKSSSDLQKIAAPPVQLDYVFDFIQETIDFRALHEKLSFKMLSEIKTDATQGAIEAVKVAQEDIKKTANESVKDVSEKIEKQLDEEIKGQMINVNKSISETSVTILGMFSGIVLAIVAGLFYSSSVMESVSEAEIYRLLAVAAIVGIVCFDLVALMFMYINKIRGNEKSARSFLHYFIIGVNLLLVVIMVLSLFQMPEANEKQNQETNPKQEEEIDIINQIELG